MSKTSLHREPVLLRAILTTAGICTTSLIAVLNSAASVSCQTAWLGLECISWYIGIAIVLPLSLLLLWHGMVRDDREVISAKLQSQPLWSSFFLAAFSTGCAILAWVTFSAISTSCTPHRWGFDCSSHLVGVIVLALIAVSGWLLCLCRYLTGNTSAKSPLPITDC